MDKTKIYEFLGQGFTLQYKTPVRIVAEKEKTILIENLDGKLIGVFTKDFVREKKNG